MEVYHQCCSLSCFYHLGWYLQFIPKRSNSSFNSWTEFHLYRQVLHCSFNQFPSHRLSLFSHWVVSICDPMTAACQTPLSFTISRSLLRFMSLESMMLSNHLILCCPLLLLPSLFSNIRVFSKESALCIRWPKYWSLSFSISPSNEYSGLISFRIDRFDLLRSQGLSKSLLQHHSSKTSILQCSAFFMVQLSHLYMTTGKVVALTIRTFVYKVMSQLFKMLSRFVIAFLPKSKCLLISWLQSTSAMILEPPQNKICHCFYFFPFYLPWSDETRYHDLSFFNVEL